MTVAEFIEKLKELPPHLIVLTSEDQDWAYEAPNEFTLGRWGREDGPFGRFFSEEENKTFGENDEVNAVLVGSRWDY